MLSNENENEQLCYQNFNQKILANSGVQLYFGNVFDQTSKSRVPTIKNKLRRILVDFGFCQTCVEIDQKLNYIKVWYRDPKATELKGTLLQKYNSDKESQAIELNVSLEGSLINSPSKNGIVKTYTGLTKLIYQDFIEDTKSSSMADDNLYNEMKTIIKQGNLAACVPLSAILTEEVY